jgi:hypothetical protein
MELAGNKAFVPTTGPFEANPSVIFHKMLLGRFRELTEGAALEIDGVRAKNVLDIATGNEKVEWIFHSVVRNFTEGQGAAELKFLNVTPPLSAVRDNVKIPGLPWAWPARAELKLESPGVALGLFGVRAESTGATISIEGGQELAPVDATVPGDLSSAVFWAVAAAGTPGGAVSIEQVGLNPTRRAVLDVLGRAGAEVEESIETTEGGEPAGRLLVRHGGLLPFVVTPDEVPALIDELPALAALATHGGEMTVTGASELRVKESDRITALVAGLRALGAAADELPDGFHVDGRRPLSGGTANAAGDHRLAMAFALAALGGRGPSVIEGADAVDVSYPGFFETLGDLTA